MKFLSKVLKEQLSLSLPLTEKCEARDKLKELVSKKEPELEDLKNSRAYSY